MKKIWFKKTEWGFLPTLAILIVFTLLMILLLLPTYAFIVRSSPSISNDLYHLRSHHLHTVLVEAD